MRRWPMGSVAIHRHVNKDVFPKLIWSSLCWGEDKNVVDADTSHREARMVFLAMNSIDISEEAKVWRWSRQSLSRDSMKMPLSRKGSMKWKAMRTTDSTQAQSQACCSRWNDKMRKIDVSLARRRKLCSGKKDRLAQLKSCHDKI